MSLFTPGRIGRLDVPNRLVMAPLGRARSSEPGRAPLPRVATYYAQRATAGLIVSEATQVSPNSVSRPHGSGIHSGEQVAAWRTVTDAVHAAGGRIFQQHFHLGRKAHPSRLPAGVAPVAPSAIAALGTVPTPAGLAPWPVPRALETDEVAAIVEEFRLAAANADAAGFDGVELHAANGFLIDQFLRDRTNRRTDRYGGSIANRARFLLEIVDAAISELGANRVGVRISPHNTQDGIGDSDPAALYAYVARELDARGIAYLHLIERIGTPPEAQFAGDLRRLFGNALILCGDYTADLAQAALAERRADFVAFGRAYIANPDLALRFRLGAPLNPPDPDSFYVGGDAGYIDYPFLDEAVAQQLAAA